MLPPTENNILESALDKLLAEFPHPENGDTIAFLRRQYDLGLAWVHFGRGFGGLGLAAGRQAEVDRKVRLVGGPASPGDFMALNLVATTIDAVGTAEQRRQYLPRIFTGEDHWCQLFSEPGAGSDLAGLATRATLDGDEWIINGQKIWTSGAREARYGLLLARSDPSVRKHHGMTLLICDMSAEGVELRPLRQADGGATFNEVFLTDVRVPDACRLGECGEGWRTTAAALHSERDGTADAFTRPVEGLLKLWEVHGPRASPALRDRVVQMWIESKVLDLLKSRQRASYGSQGVTSLGSLIKVAASEHLQRMGSVTATLLGPHVLVGADYDDAFEQDINGDSQASHCFASLPPLRFLLRSIAMSIEGGTNEIQRNIVAETLLGLPSDIRVDKDIPWDQVRRG